MGELKAPDAHRASGESCWTRATVVLLLALLVGALLLNSWAAGLNWQQSVAAQPQPFTIPVYDYTSQWRDDIKAGVQRWDAALAPRGIQLSYSPQTPTPCESLAQPGSGISLCEATTAALDERWADGEHQQIWVADGTIHVRGRVRFFQDAPENDFADMVVCHELGHTLQLSHVPDGSDSCMTQPPGRVDPSGWDGANALSFIPEDQSLAVPQEETQEKDKERKKEKKEKTKDKKKEKKKEKNQGEKDRKLEDERNDRTS